ncbi:gamma-glutamyltransferase [Candidatus Nitronereus thalassa]|uniref:Glutathione hydrolase proenzyme n=1 Tax=Candidatus Nitronereus thalassa TaxID=3020898 RepID=A0ABU3K343_9BACT|nr:gamma-glutamyltransferase [Candidatus Nitronereus thalassa]MDT7040807.1 gamma-glutamyltransferase [Candidatus Nitronereus thalassa]
MTTTRFSFRVKKSRAPRLSVFYLLITISVLGSSSVEARVHDHSIGVPGVHGGVVSTSEEEATKVGATILRQGGNAIDAAAAVAFALNVVEPQNSGIGGGGFMMVYLAKTKETLVIDSRETAPALADPNMFLDIKGHPFSFAVASTSGISVGVPGMVRGIALALEKWGTMSLAQALAPAIQLASEGFRISHHLAEDIHMGLKNGRLAHEPGNAAFEEARKVFAPKGIPLKQNDMLVQSDLANTFRFIAQHGVDTFYTDEMAKAIVATQRHARTTSNPANQKKLQGRMTTQDLRNYRPVIRKPVEGMYRKYRIASAPPPSSGGLTLLYILKLLERFPLGDKTQGFGNESARTFHVLLEAMRLGFADRAVWMGDGDVVPVPIEGLLHPKYITSRSGRINPEKRQPTITAGNPLTFATSQGNHILKIQESPPPVHEGLHTTHFTIIDHVGNIVTYTNTIESLWGTGLMVPGYGFLLNNELTDFNLVPTLNTDQQDFNPGANDVAPGKRPRSSMAPTIVFQENTPITAYGSPGGPTIINSVVNVTINLIDHHMSIQEAIDAPRLSQTSANGSLILEGQFNPVFANQLQALGHNIDKKAQQKIGAVQAVVIDESSGTQYGAADQRRGGRAISLSQQPSSPPLF